MWQLTGVQYSDAWKQQRKLEQIERLRSEDTPRRLMITHTPIPLSHIGSQVKRRQSQSYKFKEFAKISNFWTNIKRDTHSEVAW